jgi:DNA invertase Pin-like site-specific DNA recombinase
VTKTTKAPRYVAYYRVSTVKQGKSGLGLEAQREAVTGYLNGGNWNLIAEFVEVESGKNDDRAQLRAALEQCRLTGATLIIAKIDRLSRNVAFISALMETSVDFVAVDMPTANRLTIHILAAVAEHEREMISARTKAALSAARARGMVLGGFRGHVPDHRAGNAAAAARALEFGAQIMVLIAPMVAEGASLRKIAAYLTEQQIQTPRGGAWTATGVKNVIDRASQIAA